MRMEPSTIGVMAAMSAMCLAGAACGVGSEEAQPVAGIVQSEIALAEESSMNRCHGLDGGGRTVGFANLSDEVPFAQTVRQSIESVAAECNIKLVLADNMLDGVTALQNARMFAETGVDGVIEFQVDANIEHAVCDGLNGIPTIAIDIAHPSCAQFIGVDNAAAGELAGDAVAGLASERWNCAIDAVVSLEAFGAGVANVERMNGALRGIHSRCRFLNMGNFENWSAEVPDSIISRLDSGFREGGQATGEEWLAANPDAKRIAAVCINDDSCLGFSDAVSASGRDVEVVYASNGADSSVRPEIRSNPNFAGSTGIFPELYGELVIPAIIAAMDSGADTSLLDPLLMEHVFINADVIDLFYPANLGSDCQIAVRCS